MAMHVFAVIMLTIEFCSTLSGQVRTRGPAGQSGLVYSGSASFWIDAPPGWVLDPDAGRSDGPIVVLYRQGKNWRTSEPVMYANVKRPRESASISVANVIEGDIAEWDAEFADLVVTQGDSVKTAGRQVAAIRVFQSGSANHYEAVAYVAGEQQVWLLVLAARSSATFRIGYPDFLKLVKSYAPGPTVKTP
jgi:hypothetical protein